VTVIPVLSTAMITSFGKELGSDLLGEIHLADPVEEVDVVCCRETGMRAIPATNGSGY
jgi:hypothetical protein